MPIVAPMAAPLLDKNTICICADNLSVIVNQIAIRIHLKESPSSVGYYALICKPTLRFNIGTTPPSALLSSSPVAELVERRLEMR
ncbi:MAG: hypothetical protein CM15mP74_03580 [Halieaceae bacterium]|nr:MAG: hypothetical protein CM15mP74_03580 [Halieaceae bacterium]